MMAINAFVVFVTFSTCVTSRRYANQKDVISASAAISSADSKYNEILFRQLEELDAMAALEATPGSLGATSFSQVSAKLNATSTTPFHDSWLKKEEQDPSIKSRLCSAESLAKIDCEIGDGYPSNCQEFCGKLAGILEAQENVVGTFPRCAARLHKKVAEKFSSPADATDFGCWMTPFSQAGFMKYWEMYQKGAAILVMGQGLNPDGSSPPTLTRRAVKAAELYRQHQVPVIVSGGDDRATGMTEAYPLARVMFENGVPYEAIILESQATTTLENFWFGFRQIRRYLHPKDKLKIMLVTHDWHMPRASYFGRVAAHYFKNKDKVFGAPEFFSKMNIQIEEVTVKSYCSEDPDFSGSDVMGSNKQSFVNKASAEANALQNHITGPERHSVGEESLDNNVWGTELDPLDSVLQAHRNWINQLKKWAESHQCTGLPDTEEGQFAPDELLKGTDRNSDSRSAACLLSFATIFALYLQ